VRALRALGEFGAPLAEISETDLATPGVVYHIVGVPTGRVDLLTELTGSRSPKPGSIAGGAERSHESPPDQHG